MNNKMNEMMNAMMEQMMGKMMESMMESMMNAMMTAMTGTPEVANAEAVEQPKAVKTGTKAISREEFLAMAEAPTAKNAVPEVDYSELDVMAYGNKMVKYNQQVNSNIWQYTDMVVRTKYNGRCTKYRGEFVWVFDNPADRKNFLQCFQIKTEFSDEELQAIKLYKKNKQIARAKKLLESEEQ